MKDMQRVCAWDQDKDSEKGILRTHITMCFRVSTNKSLKKLSSVWDMEKPQNRYLRSRRRSVPTNCERVPE